MLLSARRFFSAPSGGRTTKGPWDLHELGEKMPYCSLVTGAKRYCRRMWSN